MGKELVQVYLGAPFFNDEERDLVKVLEKLIEELGFKLFSPSKEAGILAPDATVEERFEVWQSNITGMDQARIGVMVIDNRDPGVMFESGYMHHAGEFLVTFSNKDYKLNVMLEFPVIAHTTSEEDLRCVLLELKNLLSFATVADYDAEAVKVMSRIKSKFMNHGKEVF